MILQVREILDNAIDEVQAGHASTVQVPRLAYCLYATKCQPKVVARKALCLYR